MPPIPLHTSTVYVPRPSVTHTKWYNNMVQTSSVNELRQLLRRCAIHNWRDYAHHKDPKNKTNRLLRQYNKPADTHTVLWSRRAERLGAYGVQMNHTLVEPFCRRELGRKRGQGHWRCWQAALLVPTPSEQTWQQWHLLWNSGSKVRQSVCLANTRLLQVTTRTVNKAYCNSETNCFFCIFIPIPFFPSFLPSPVHFTHLSPSLPSPVLFPIPSICSSDHYYCPIL